MDSKKDISEFGIAVVEKLIIYLISFSKDYVVIDRSHLQSILKEHKLALIGLTEPENIKKLGQVSGVDALVVGTITEKYDTIEITAKILDVSTAEVKGGYSISIYKTKSIEDQLRRIVDLEPPSVVIARPMDNATVSGVIRIITNISDNKGIAKVEYYIDDVLFLSKVDPPYDIDLDTTLYDNGLRTIRIRVLDEYKNESSAQIKLNFQNKISDRIPPTVNIVYPKDREIISGNINLYVDAKDNEGISRVEIYINQKLWDTKTTPPFSFTWNTRNYVNGNYEITAKAIDKSGNSSTHKIGVKVDNDFEPPFVKINSPKDRAIVSGVTNLNIDAYDNRGLSGIEIYLDGKLIKRFDVKDLNFSYSYPLDTKKLEDKEYKIEVYAIDIESNKASSIVYIKVKNKPVEETPKELKNTFLILGLKLIPTAIGTFYGGTFEGYSDNLSIRISYLLLKKDQYTSITFFESLLLFYFDFRFFDLYSGVGIGSSNALPYYIFLITTGFKINISNFGIFGEFTLASNGDILFPWGFTLSF
ncbi:MAG: Ig-like domain-containing protein [Candidatus Micrarchaeia archaeon]